MSRRGLAWLLTIAWPDAFPNRSLTPEQFGDRMAQLAGVADVTAALVTVRFDGRAEAIRRGIIPAPQAGGN